MRGALRTRGARSAVLAVLILLGFGGAAWAHGVSAADQSFVERARGVHLVPYAYLGAKHMVTGYDHLLFLLGVIFFLRHLRDVGLYVTLFAAGHSATLLGGVLGEIQVDPYLVDAVIGLSVVYKAFDNLSGFPTLFGVRPDPRIAVLGFGLVHGFGLATKLQDLALPPEGLVPNILAFNVGVELGQLTALSLILVLMAEWRRREGFLRQAVHGNLAIMAAGFLLMGYQLAGYALGRSS